MITSDRTSMLHETPKKRARQTMVKVRPTSFMIDLERNTAEVAITSSVHDMAWLVSFEISPAPANPGDWNAKISEAYSTLLLRERLVASDGAIFENFFIGASNDPPYCVRLVDSVTRGLSGMEARRDLLEAFVGADIGELLLG
jgi:hypothetical protein